MKKLLLLLLLLAATFYTKAQNVGIGTTTPQFPLSFLSVPGDKISLWSDGSSTHYGFGIQGGLLQIFAKNDVDDIAFGYGSSTSFTERMRIKGNGNVGIGTTSPTTTLHVSAGEASLALFGPNTTGGKLYIGASGNQAIAGAAQIISSDGNLHIDPAPDKNIYIGYFQPRNVIVNPIGGNVGIGTTTPSATLEVNGYTKLGNDAPSIKYKKLTGTTAATEGGIVVIYHGLTGSKILSVSIMVLNGVDFWVGPNYEHENSNFGWQVNGSFVLITNFLSSSAYILSKPIKILITYEE